MSQIITSYPTLQVTQINQVPFKFSNKSPGNPLAPLVAAEFYENEGVLTLKIRATLYIDAQNTTIPTVVLQSEKENILNFVFDYDYCEVEPTSYNIWYVEIDYTSDTVGNIDTVMTYLRDIDPKTSRGTVTTVQQGKKIPR